MASLFISGKVQEVDAAGNPLNGGKLHTYAAGTLTPLATYTTQAGNVSNTNPVILGSDGRANVWLGSAAYRMILTDATGATTFYDTDNMIGSVASVDLSASTGSSLVGHIAIGAGTVARTVQAKLREVSVSITDFTGADSTGATSSLAALQAAITDLRLYTESRIDTIGGTTISMYRSGTIFLPPGVWAIPANSLQIAADMGVTFQGAGSRRFTNAIQGRTTLLITGAATSSQYGISFYRNGARSCQFRDLDICYRDNTFAGHLIDSIDAPGLKLYNCYIGTFGFTGPTRLQTAASLFRLTYLEDILLEDCTLDGAVDGIWVDDIRIELANPFGGWGLVLNRCTFYDVTGRYVRHDGARTLTNVSILDCHFNPISMDHARSVDLNNIDGLTLVGNIFTPSTTGKATTEWLRLVNCTGVVEGNAFNDLSKAGTLNGNLSVAGNVCAGTDGFTLTGGVIAARSNEFSTGTRGYDLVPTEDLCVTLGPDRFKAAVTNSYRIATDSAFLAGRIDYNASTDGSASKFSNTSGRIAIGNVDGKQYSISATSYTLLNVDTGRAARATGVAGQVFTLPAPVPGTKHRVFKASDQTLQITAGSAILYAGTGAIKTSISAAAPDIGGSVELTAYDTSGWVVASTFGAWTLA